MPYQKLAISISIASFLLLQYEGCKRLDLLIGGKMNSLMNSRLSQFFSSFLVFIFPSIFLSTAAPAAPFDDLEKLVEGAKKEGRLMLYTSSNIGQADLLLSKFREQYPFIQTEYYRSGKVALLSKILMEQRFKKHTADAIVMSLLQSNILKKQGALDKSSPPESRVLPEEFRDPQGYWYAVNSSELVCAYNKNLVSPKDAPKTYEDLLDPRWRGKLAIERNKIEWFATVLKMKGESFFEKLSRQRPSVRIGEQLATQLLAAGEYSILADTQIYEMLASQDKGMPIDFIPLEPVVIYFIAGSVAANAPHPNAAKLYINFLLTQTGQQAVVKWGRTPVRSDVGSRNKKIIEKYKVIVTDIDTGEREKEINQIIGKYFR